MASDELAAAREYWRRFKERQKAIHKILGPEAAQLQRTPNYEKAAKARLIREAHKEAYREHNKLSKAMKAERIKRVCGVVLSPNQVKEPPLPDFRPYQLRTSDWIGDGCRWVRKTPLQW